MKQTLIIPNWHPPLNNQIGGGVHWAVRRRLKAACTAMIWKSCLDQKMVKASGRRLVEIIITYPKQRGSMADPDAFYKATLDSLKHCNMLIDDSGKWCEHAATLVQRGATKQTTIILTDIG